MKNLLSAVLLVLCGMLAACKGGAGVVATADALPETPDYGDSTQWYVSDRQAEADVFYIVSTETGDYLLADGTECHYADTYRDSLRLPLYSEMLGVDTLLSGRLNYYSPYYRQCSLQTFMNDSTAKARMQTPLDDIRRAFAYYLEHLNGGRPFVLAGFSQGAVLLLELLKEMDDDTYSRMIAAYAIGISIPQEVVDSCPHVIAAQSAEDTGVTICYNSVRDASCALWGKSAVAINPVNWQTDSTSAVVMTEPSPFIPIDRQQKDTLHVQLDVATGLLFVTGVTATDYELPLIGKKGNYHSREIWFYRQQLRENIALRTANFL